jgi:CHAT domain-containing protein/tetratricopeptide (TPR) repeat protein
MRRDDMLAELLAELEELDEATEHLRVIAVCEAIAALVPRQENPHGWAGMMLMIAGALVRNPAHDPAGDIRRAIGCCEAAQEVFDQRSMPQPWAMVQDLTATAYCQWADGNRDDNIERAIAHYEQALSVGPVLPVDFLAGVHNNIGAALLDRMRGSQADNVESAVEHLEAALVWYEAAGAPREPALGGAWARAEDNLGRAYAARLRGDPASNVRTALASFDQALTVRTREEFPADFAVTSANVAAVLADRSPDRAEGIQQAIRRLEAALLALLECPREQWPPNWGLLVQRLSGAYADRLIGDPGDNARHAIEFLEIIRPVLFAVPVGVNLPDTGRTDEAHVLAALGQAYASPGLRNAPEYSDHLEQGIRHLTEALALYDRDIMPLHWARAQNSLGVVYADRVAGDRASNLRYAIGCFDDTLTIYTTDAFPLERAAGLHNLGAAYADLAAAVSDPAERTRSISLSIDSYTGALQVIRVHGDAARRLTTAWELGKACADDGRWAEASSAYLEAIEIAEAFYAASLLQDAKDAELAHVFGLYQDAAYALSRSGRLKRAVRVLERGRSRGLSESLARDRADLSELEQEDPALAAAYREAADLVNELERQQRQLSSASGNPLEDLMAPVTAVRSATASGMREAVRAALNGLNAVVQQIQARFPRLLASPGWPEICQALTEQQPVVYLAVTHHGGLTLLLRAKPGTQARPFGTEDVTVTALFAGDDRGDLLRQLDGLLLTFDKDDKVIGGFLAGQRRNDPSWLSDALGQLLPLLGDRIIAPLAEQLRESGATAVAFLAGPPLGLLPLHAAAWQQDGRLKMLLNDFDVSYAPAARVLGMARAAAQARSAQAPSLTAVADPPRDDLPQLPFASAEVSAAAAFFGADRRLILDPGQATPYAVERAGAEATYVHLACHGEFNLDDPPRSRIFLAEGTELTLGDIMNSRPFPAARLVVMSACQTAITDIRRLPDEAVGFPAGILQSGVPGVIGTLWPVDDLACALLMTRFYQYHLQGCPSRGAVLLSAPAALSQAQRWLGQATSSDILTYCQEHPALGSVLAQSGRRAWLSAKDPESRPFGHPLSWAPFVYVGA